MRSEPHRRWWVRVAWVFVLVGAAEIASRLWSGGLPLSPRYFASDESREGIRLRQNTRYRYIHDGRPVIVSIDSEGHRIVVGAPQAGSSKTVHLLGDSQVFGWGLSDEETVATWLQRELGTDWRIVNRGVPGWGPREFATELARVPPGEIAIILHTEENDLEASYAVSTLPIERCGFLAPPTFWGERLPCLVLSSHLFARTVSLWIALDGGERALPIAYNPKARAAAAVLRHRVASLYRAAEREAPTLFGVVPWDATIARERLEAYRPRIAAPVRTADFPDDFGIEAAFRTTEAPETLFLSGDPHLSPRGARLAASVLATRLLAETRTASGHGIVREES